MRVEFVTQGDRNDGFPAANPARLINFFPEPMPEGSAARFQLRAVPGTQPWAFVGGAVVRALAFVGPDPAEEDRTPRLFAAVGGKLLQITELSAVNHTGDIEEDAETWIDSNNGDVTVTAGGKFFVWDGSAMDEPGPGPFDGFGGHVHLGGYTVLTQRGGRRFCWSGLQNAGTLPGLNFATAEARDDFLIRPMAAMGNLWLMKERSIEVWALSGEAGANAFTRIPGAVIDRGLLAYGLVASTPDGLVFVGDDGVVYITIGTTTQRISSPAVNAAVKAERPSHCFYYEHEGHRFFVLRFRDRPAWVCDLSHGGLWHERASGDGGAWRVTAAAKAFGRWLGAGIGGSVWRFCDQCEDAGEPLIRSVVSRDATMESQRFRVHAIEAQARVGLLVNGGRDGRLQMRVSRDGGITWGAWKERSLGFQGEFWQRVVFWSLGQARRFAIELRASDNADIRLLSAVDARLG